MIAKSRLSLIGRYAALTLLTLFVVTPALWLFLTAFKSSSEIVSGVGSFFPREFTWENFAIALREQPIIKSALNSAVVSVASAVLTVILAVPAAYFVARYRSRASSGVMIWVILSQMFPYILISIPLFLVLIRVGLYDNLFGLVLVYTVWNLPFCLWMLRNFIEGIPFELEEAAAIDGAGRFTILRRVVGPLLVPGLVVTAVFSFINSWNEFFFALVLIKNPDIAPLSLLLVRFIGVDGNLRLGPLAAAALIATIPSIVAFAVLQRRISGGLIGGAVKG